MTSMATLWALCGATEEWWILWWLLSDERCNEEMDGRHEVANGLGSGD